MTRRLLVVADDYGIGPETSRGIRELMQTGVVPATVLLVNSPHAEDAMRLWHGQGALGWHPCLTMDRPLAPPSQVRSLLSADGTFLPLGKFLKRWLTGQVRYREIVRELDCQYQRFLELVGHPPALVNGHQHIHLFPACSRALLEVFSRHRVSPYVRRVREPMTCLSAIPGARFKRLCLTAMGHLAARRQAQARLPGNDWLAGITDPPHSNDPTFFSRWLQRIPGRFVELMVHPGHHDETLVGRDCHAGDGNQQRRVAEYAHLSHPAFSETCRLARFVSVRALNGIIPT